MEEFSKVWLNELLQSGGVECEGEECLLILMKEVKEV